MIFSVGTWFSLNSFTYVPIVGHCNIQSTLKCFFILNGKVSSVGSMCTTEGVRVLPLFLADRTAAATQYDRLSCRLCVRLPVTLCIVVLRVDVHCTVATGL